MGLDGIVYKLKIVSPESESENLDKIEIIKKNFVHKKDSDKLFVMLPGSGGTLKYNVILRKIISKNNYSFLEYEFPNGILSSDWKKTLEYFDLIRDEVIHEIKYLKKEHRFDEVYLAGVSLGTFHACRIANNNKDIKELCLITPGHCLAETIWTGIETQNIRREYESQGISMHLLKKYWRELAPENNVDNLKVKHITVAVSKADQVVPFYSGDILVDKLKKHKYNVTYHINNSLGHFFTGAKFYSNPEKILFQK
jgi:esterase/lipase